RRAPALWRSGEVKLDCLAAGTRARLGGEFSGAGLKDQRRDLLGAVDAHPGAEHPAARAVAIGLVRCQSEALAHDASTLAAAPRAVNPLTPRNSHQRASPRAVRPYCRRQLLATAASLNRKKANLLLRPKSIADTAHFALTLTRVCGII